MLTHQIRAMRKIKKLGPSTEEGRELLKTLSQSEIDSLQKDLRLGRISGFISNFLTVFDGASAMVLIIILLAAALMGIDIFDLPLILPYFPLIILGIALLVMIPTNYFIDLNRHSENLNPIKGNKDQIEEFIHLVHNYPSIKFYRDAVVSRRHLINLDFEAAQKLQGHEVEQSKLNELEQLKDKLHSSKGTA